MRQHERNDQLWIRASIIMTVDYFTNFMLGATREKNSSTIDCILYELVSGEEPLDSDWTNLRYVWSSVVMEN